MPTTAICARFGTARDNILRLVVMGADPVRFLPQRRDTLIWRPAPVIPEEARMATAGRKRCQCPLV